ncbi:MAG: hypothetical protein ACYC0F_06385 [Rhodanobacter sp.]
MSMPPPVPAARSTFVTVLGSIFAALAGFATLIGLAQNLMFQLVLQPAMQEQLAAQPVPPGMPASMGWMFVHMVWLFRGFLLLSIITLVAAIGLLLRRNWGRRLFIGLMAFAIVYQLLGLVLQWWFMGSMQQVMQLQPGVPAQFSSGIQGFMWVMRIFSTLIAIGLGILFSWIIRRLCSAPIRHEFVRTGTSFSASGSPR